MKPPKSEIRKWIKALRSGEYRQARGRLQTERGYCCLGVACKVFIPPKLQQLTMYDVVLSGGLPGGQPAAPRWLKNISENFERLTGLSLVALNDMEWNESDVLQAFTFDEIADLLQLVYLEEVLG